MITTTEPMKDLAFRNSLTSEDLEHLEKDAWEFIKGIVKAEKLKRKEFCTLASVHINVLGLRNEIQITNLPYLCKLLGFEYVREDWDGNEACDSNYDILYFMYKGYKFFELDERRNGVR